MAAKQGPNVLFFMPNRADWILLVSAMEWCWRACRLPPFACMISEGARKVPAGDKGPTHGCQRTTKCPVARANQGKMCPIGFSSADAGRRQKGACTN
jgi:hypothetical protein